MRKLITTASIVLLSAGYVSAGMHEQGNSRGKGKASEAQVGPGSVGADMSAGEGGGVPGAHAGLVGPGAGQWGAAVSGAAKGGGFGDHPSPSDN